MKPTSHKQITSFALEIFQENSSTLFADLIAEERFRDALIEGTADEDNVSYLRGTNWHFYPANDELKHASRTLCKSSKIVVRPTSDSILTFREQELRSGLTDGHSKQLFQTMGRILHHIQDMSTPSHVVPVYHGILVKDPYETFLVENWPAMAQRLTLYQRDLRTIIEEPQSSLSQLYHSAAAKLLNTLLSPDFSFRVQIDGGTAHGTGDLVWIPFESTDPKPVKGVPFHFKGFGKFGPIGRRFGRTSLFEDHDHTYKIEVETYLNLAFRFVRMATEDTLRALHIFDAMSQRFQY